jgi:hypothetical protein
MGYEAMTHFSPLNDANAEFAIVPVSEGKPPQNAIAHGSMSAVMERVADSKARSEATTLIRRAADAAVELGAATTVSTSTSSPPTRPADGAIDGSGNALWPRPGGLFARRDQEFGKLLRHGTHAGRVRQQRGYH